MEIHSIAKEDSRRANNSSSIPMASIFLKFEDSLLSLLPPRYVGLKLLYN